MSPNLLEREQFLASLDERLARAGRGNGQCVLLGGEAGIGKTSLLEHFAEQHCDAAHFLWGRCEALYTPRPLGPLHDMALRLDGLAQVLADATPNRAAIFSDFLRLLQVQRHQVALIFEDVHWADEATLDLIKFPGRRLQQTSILLLVTYRDDEVGADHKL
jgi:predicted ATPase